VFCYKGVTIQIDRLSDLKIFAICSNLETVVNLRTTLSCVFPVTPLFLMGNAHITPGDQRNPVSASEAGSSQGGRVSEMIRANYVNAKASEVESTQDETARYLPKRMNRSNNGVIMPSKPNGCGGASTVGGIESPHWGWYISITPPASDMYHSGSRPLHDSLAVASQASSGKAASELSAATSHRPNRIFKDMHKKKRGTSVGWSSVPL
jgi:hypothetical protein